MKLITSHNIHYFYDNKGTVTIKEKNVMFLFILLKTLINLTGSQL